MAEAVDIAPGVRIPAAALEVRSVRASGPGGQNVNKVASKVELLFDPAAVEGLPADALARLVRLAGRRLAADGRIRVTSQESRDRSRNLESARAKAAELVARALVVPRRRRATRPTSGSRAARLRTKTRDAVVKLSRRAPGPED